MIVASKINGAAAKRSLRGRVAAAFLLPVGLAPLLGNAGQAGAQLSIPQVEVTALDGHAVSLPRDLPGRSTVLIMGFGRKSAEATTAWERPVRGSLAHAPEIGFFDMAMLAEVPGFARGFVMRLIRNKVPDVLKPSFLPLFNDEDAWKRAAGYDDAQPEAAYVMVVDRRGTVRWSTHEAYNAERFALMAAQANALASEAK